MKSYRFLKLRLLPPVIVTALAAVSCETFPDEGSMPSTVMKLEGDARCSVDGKTWKAIKVGDWIAPGSIVQTADSGFDLVISLGEGIAGPNMPTPSGNLWDPAVRPANLLRFDRDTIVKLSSTSSEKLPDSNGRKEVVELSLERGRILGWVKRQTSKYEVRFKGGLFTMRDGKYVIDDSGNVAVWDGQGGIRIPNLTNRLSALQSFDAKTGTIKNFPSTSPFSVSDPISEPGWATPPHVKPGSRVGPEVQFRF